MISHTVDRECRGLGKNENPDLGKIDIYIYICIIIYMYICGQTGLEVQLGRARSQGKEAAEGAPINYIL